MNNNKSQYMSVENRPIGCQFCGANVQGRVTEKLNFRTKDTIKECRWVCSRCGNLSKVGIVK